MKKTIAILAILFATVTVNAQEKAKIKVNVIANPITAEAGASENFVFTKKTNTADLQNEFWADPQVQALTKKEENFEPKDTKIKRLPLLWLDLRTAKIDQTSGTYISTDKEGNKTKWLAIRYKSIEESTKKPITLCMLKNIDKNIITVWAEYDDNNYSVNITGSKETVNIVKLGTKGTISFSQNSVAEVDCRGVSCNRCQGPGCTGDMPK